MSAILLIRHTETDLAGKFCGHSDPDLNATGERRLISLVEEIAPLGVSRIYSSDLRRAAQTAAAIGRRIGVAVEFRPGLREIDFGIWEGSSWGEIERRYPREAELWLKALSTRAAPGGEPYPDFVARVEAEFDLLLSKSTDGKLAVVTHRGVMQCALTRFFDISEADAWQRTEQYGAVVVVDPVKRFPDRSGNHRTLSCARCDKEDV